MNVERTLSIIKPNAINEGNLGHIQVRIIQAKLNIIALKMIKLTREQAEDFYAEHADKPFFERLVRFMISGPIVVQVLEGENAIKKYRELMGETDPNKQIAGTLRHDFAENVTENSVHGSDSEGSAKKEIDFFFNENEIFKTEQKISFNKTINTSADQGIN